MVIVLNKEEPTVTAWVMQILQGKNSISKSGTSTAQNTSLINKHTLNISMFTTPGPFPLIMLVSSASLNPLGTLPTNNLCFA
jgi:hypothetical protein